MTVSPDAVNRSTLPESHFEGLNAEELRTAYRVGARSRCAEEHVVRLVNKGEVKFAIWGPGEEVAGAATALALSKVVDTNRFGFIPHYRCGAMCSLWTELNGQTDFTLAMFRQQFSRATDEMSGGRQMVYHLYNPKIGILPVQSPVGMQLGKAAGYALGFKALGIEDGVAMAVVGDGTTAEGDMHDAMNAASVWSLPLLILVTDNNVAISTTPEEGRGIKDFEAYAKAFGFEHYAADGRDFMSVYRAVSAAASHCRVKQRPAILHIKDLPRFNGHSSAADVTFDLTQDDPLIGFGDQLVEKGILEANDVLRRVPGSGRDFFAHHDLGRVMSEEDTLIREIMAQVRAEPHPSPDHLFDHIYAPFPQIEEPAASDDQTVVSYAGAIRSAIDKLIRRKNAVLAGQDVGRLGGVMTATAGLKAAHPESIIDSPLNEPLIVGTSTGLALHPELMAVPEIQFGDYSLNAFHWLVYMGNLRWSTMGQAKLKMVLRMPTDPFGGGAMYHSMSLDGFFGSIPGLVIIMPSTTYDAHGLLLAAGDYDGPVVCLEPKWMYRQTLGPALPGEPTDATAVRNLKKSIMRGEIPNLPDVKVPLGKGIIRRAGADLTVVAWGRAVWTCLEAAEALSTEGIEIEVIDLRTIVPPDMALIQASIERTGRLIVAAEDRTFGGFVRQIQGKIVDENPGLPTRALGQKNVPGIGQSLVLEHATVLRDADVVAAARELVQVNASSGSPSGWSWVPPRYFIS